MKVGILGGTFNPIHSGHINIASHSYSLFGLDKIILIPTNIPPHKTSNDLVSGVDRLNMCRLAVRELDYAYVSDVELRRDGPSRTLDTLIYLTETYPEDEFYLIIGSDMFLTFDQWYKFKEILKMVSLCVFCRSSRDRETIEEKKQYFKDLGASIYIGDVPMIEISSTELRQVLIRNEDASVYLHKDVLKYIDAVNLYNPNEDDEIENYKTIAKGMLSTKRYEHSINVAKEAVRIGIIYGDNLRKAYLSGILHDILKEKNTHDTLQILSDSDIICTEKYKNYNTLWHSILGAKFVKDRLGIDDNDIINAIRYHTSGRANMSTLEMIVFLADIISFDRRHPDVETVRELTDLSLEKGMLYVLSFSLQMLIEKQEFICDDTFQAYNYYLDIVKNS